MIAELEGYREFVAEQMALWKVPGTAIAVIKNGELAFAEGFGLRNVEANLPVTPDTVFAIGSASKAFTTMSMGVLVDDGRLAWDNPVRDYLPTFRLWDPYATERMTLRDLVTHRSGLPRHDLMWYNSPLSRQELFDCMRYLEPNKDFRTYFQYQNLMYMTAGHLVGQLADSTWEQVVEERIFRPLEMRCSSFSVDDLQRAADFSLPYEEKKGEVRQIPFRNIDAIGPAGSINSNLVDMANWVLLHVNNGQFKGQQVISPGNLSQMHTPQMVIQGMPGMDLIMKYKEIGLPSYGMGWFINAYRGHTLIHHGGNIDGFSSLVSFVPDEGVGVVVLTNMNSSFLTYVATFDLYDRLLSLCLVDWGPRLKGEMDAMLAAVEKGKEKSEAERRLDAPPSHPLAAYAGVYQHPGYGPFAVTLDGDRLTAHYNQFDLPMTHYHYDIFEARLEAEDMELKASFATDVQGRIASVSLPMEGSVKDIVFARVAPQSMREQSFLEPFAGAYDLMGTQVHIALQGEHTLVLAIPGQPEHELEPVEGTEFAVKDQPGVRLEFKRDEVGSVTEMVVTQSGAVLSARRV
ncbi:MAG: serine hydrolase [Chloroflexi bacterium]|nr:MAG: serine hydrolase [Chloroflexota bacterium]